MKLSVEIEPPKGAFQDDEEKKAGIYKEVRNYVNHVDMISITNRPVFGLSPLTLASQVHKLIQKIQGNARVNLHLTTRLSHFDTFKYVLDAHRVGLSDLLPILGDPRGPKDPNYFKNGFEILGFVSYLKSGDKEYLSKKYQEMLKKDQLVHPIDNARFNIGNVVDVNPVMHRNGTEIEIRERQIRYARKKQKLGAEYLISQGIFNADYYFDFIEQAELQIPVYPGILPARTKLINTFGIPINRLDKQRLRAQFTTEEERKIGNNISHQVFEDLKDRGCKYIHIYSIGNTRNFMDIVGIKWEEGNSKLEENPVKQS